MFVTNVANCLWTGRESAAGAAVCRAEATADGPYVEFLPLRVGRTDVIRRRKEEYMMRTLRLGNLDWKRLLREYLAQRSRRPALLETVCSSPRAVAASSESAARLRSNRDEESRRAEEWPMAVEGCCKDLFRGDYDIRGRHGTIKRRLEGPTAETTSRPVGARKTRPISFSTVFRTMSLGSVLRDIETVP